MPSQERAHDPVFAADGMTVVACTACVWRPEFTSRDLRPSEIQFESHIGQPGRQSLSPYQAVVASLELLAEEWDSTCRERCVARKDPEGRGKGQPHDCGMTMKDAAEQVRAALAAKWS